MTMKPLRLIAFAAFALLFSRCKTSSPTAPSGPAPSVLEVQRILDTTADVFLRYADSTNGNPWKAILLTESWVRSQSNVQSVATRDSTYIDIFLKSGLSAGFFFNEIDDSGFSVFRGGGAGGRPATAPISFRSLSKNKITNKKVLIYAPAWSEFNLQSTVPKTVSTLADAGLGLDVTVLKDEACTPAIANTFKDYGLVILDTHGMPDAYMSGTILDVSKELTTEAEYKGAVIRQVGQDFYDKLLNNEFRRVSITYIPANTPDWQKRKDLKRIEKVFVTTKYIKKLPQMPNTVLFGNMCYSGYSVADPGRNITYPIKTAFMDKAPISYYGFALENGKATVVTDAFSKEMEDSLTRRLAKDLDSTGMANLRPSDSAEFYDPYLDAALYLPSDRHIILQFRHFGADDYGYEKCGDTLVDARDGQKYATVCIGKQNWMAQNLDYNAPGSITYDNDPANGPIYGRLYDYKTTMQGSDASNAVPSGVRGICPKGWHVPSSAEFELLFDAVGPDATGGELKAKTLWDAPNTGATNGSGFTGLPGGFTSIISATGSSLNLGKRAYFATSSTENGIWMLENLVSENADIEGTGGLIENWGASCRCLKD